MAQASRQHGAGIMAACRPDHGGRGGTGRGVTRKRKFNRKRREGKAKQGSVGGEHEGQVWSNAEPSSPEDEKLCSYRSASLSSEKPSLARPTGNGCKGATLSMGTGPPLCTGNDSVAARVSKFASSMTLCAL